VSEQEKGSPRGSQIIDGYGDDNSLDRLQGWDYNLSADARKRIDDDFIRDVWSILLRSIAGTRRRYAVRR